MKLKHCLSMLLLAAMSAIHAFGSGRREECENVASSVGTHENGILPCIAEVTFSSRYLLAQKGTADTGVIINVAATRPWGVCLDEPTYDSNKTTKTAVAMLGCSDGTMKMVANAAVTVGQLLYTAAAGKVSPTYGATLYMVGRALTPAAADGDIIEVQHMFPMINAAATL